LASKLISALNRAHSGWTYWTWKVSYDEGNFNAWSLRTLIRNGAFNFRGTNEEVVEIEN